MSKTKALFGLAMAVALPISIEAVSVSAAEVNPPPAPPAPQVAPLDATFPLRIEAGGAQPYTDSRGRVWRADDGFIGGNVTDRGAIEIDGTSDDRIYQTERWGLSGYTVKVPNGKYTVRLHLAETFHSAVGKRIFSVQVEDRTIANLDVFAEAGARNKALVKTLDEVAVTDGEMNIDFVGAGAMVSGIEMAPFAPPPAVLTLTGGSVDENSAAGQRVATVQATGAPGDVFRYTLTQDAGGRFAIDAQAGAITVKAGANLDFETAASHEVEVAATDGRGVTTRKRFTITVLDVYEPPVLTLTGGSIEENSAAGARVATVQATGAPGDVFRYTLTQDAGGRFAIDAQAGAITVKAGATLDFEIAASHELEVAATDARGVTTKKRFTVTVLDVYEPPILSLTGGFINENAVAGERVAVVQASGAAGEVFRYALKENAAGRFVIDAQTGVITVAAGATIDFETAASHEVEVVVSDAKGMATNKRFTITVIDVNEPPVLTLTGGSINENAAAGERVAVVKAAGLAGEVFRYALTNDAGGRFVINAQTGAITVAAGAALDFETASAHSITVAADAGPGRVGEQTFQVSLADVNEPPSVIFMSAQSVDNAAPAGTLVGTVAAIDPDTGETFAYSLVDDAQGRFTIETATGAVRVAPNANLDYRAAAAHRIIVKATDAAGHSLTNGFTLNVRAPGAEPETMFIEAGATADFVDAQGRTWTADAGFIGGGIADRGTVDIAGTVDDRLYQTERWGLTGYSLPVTPGLYNVKLHFAETFATAAGARVFSVDVEGQKLNDIDVFAAAGGARTALVRSVSNVVVLDGKLDIAFTKQVGGTMVNAIEVEPVLNCQPMSR